MLRGCRLPTLVLLLLCAVPSSVHAEQFVCSPIARGDTVTTLARRLTGRAAAAYSDAFQIRDPARRMFVPKSQYQRLRTHWQACVLVRPRESAATPVAPEATALLPEEPMATPIPMAVSSVSPALTVAESSSSDRVLGPALGAAALLIFLTGVAATGWLAPRSMPAPMQQTGEAFIAAFARPLIDPASGTPPIDTRLRFVRRTQHLEIFIAPGPGRRYPNLADHKKNVEYDVNRVMRILGNHVVLADSLRARGRWVVVPIGLRSSERSETCPGEFSPETSLTSKLVGEARQGRSPSA